MKNETHENKLNIFDYSQLPKPGKNKGDRGQLFETALGIPNGSDLIDLIDGELKSFTEGETIKVTALKHCLDEIVSSVEFYDSKVYQKLKQTIYVGFDRDGKFLKSKTINEQNTPDHYQKLAEDFGYIAANGDIDTCIALRTALVKDNELIVQAGGGIVADSDPEMEFQESNNKAGAIIEAAKRSVNYLL